MANTVVKGFGFGNVVHKLLQQLESTDIVLLGPHHMRGHQTMDVSTVIAEFYEVFRVDKEGPSMMLLPTTMGSSTMAFTFGKDTSDATFGKDTGQAMVGGLPTGSVGFPDTTYNCRYITWRSGRPRREGI